MTTTTIKYMTRNGTRAALLLACSALLAACGGGGGAAAPAPVDGEKAQVAMTRTLTAFEVKVTPYKTGDAALPTRFEVSVSDATPVATLTAAIGADFDSGAAVVPTLTAPGVWGITVPAGTAAGSALLLSFNLKDGDAFETARSDFPLK